MLLLVYAVCFQFNLLHLEELQKIYNLENNENLMNQIYVLFFADHIQDTVEGKIIYESEFTERERLYYPMNDAWGRYLRVASRDLCGLMYLYFFPLSLKNCYLKHIKLLKSLLTLKLLKAFGYFLFLTGFAFSVAQIAVCCQLSDLDIPETLIDIQYQYHYWSTENFSFVLQSLSASIFLISINTWLFLYEKVGYERYYYYLNVFCYQFLLVSLVTQNIIVVFKFGTNSAKAFRIPGVKYPPPPVEVIMHSQSINNLNNINVASLVLLLIQILLTNIGFFSLKLLNKTDTKNMEKYVLKILKSNVVENIRQEEEV